MQFRRVERATLAPSCCFICRANDGPMIDTGIRGRLPMGTVYICVNRCLRDLIREGGGLSAEEAEQVRRVAARNAGDNAELEQELARLRRLEAAVAAARQEAMVA